MRLAADRHLALLHDFEECALYLGGGTVDLVGEQQVREHRAQRRLEVTRLLVVDPGADQVRRHEVGGELNALELTADRLRQRLDRHRLGEAGNTLDEDMSAGQQRNEQALDQAVLADYHLLHLICDLFECLRLRGPFVHRCCSL